MSVKHMVTDLEDLDLRLVKAWADFRGKVSDFIANVDSCTVELHFESSLDTHTHFSFEPDEVVFISDVEVSINNQVTFVVPYGSKNKTFFFTESELINANYEGEKKSLMQFIGDFYKESFKDVPEAPTITMLERKFLATNPELRDLLNSAEEAIKQYNLNIERKSAYSKFTDFGTF